MNTKTRARQFGQLPFEDAKKLLQEIGKKEMRQIFKSAEPVKNWRETLLSSDSKNQPKSFLGKNSLPIASKFQKHFFSCDDDVFGFNSSWIGQKLGYPGYFKVTELYSGELLFDYTADFPQKSLNSARFPQPFFAKNENLLFNQLQDIVRQVAPGVLIGQALKLKSGKLRPLDIYFILLSPSLAQSGAI